MNYDTVIIEMLSRIQKLEEEVRVLTAKLDREPAELLEKRASVEKKVSTGDIRDYIREQKRAAKERGEKNLIIKANDIHKAMGLQSRMPQVCNAMRQSLDEGDEVIYETASGYSSTLEIRYGLSD